MKTTIKQQRLDQLERDFYPPLLSCLRECASGRYGLFGQNDAPGVARYRQWEGAGQLQEIAIEIRKLEG
jgi:hypothetical protein